MPEFTLDDAPTSGVDLSAIGETLVNEIPEPQQHAIDEARAETAASAGADANQELDALGIPWNPDLHAKSADGSHPKQKNGQWRNKRGLRGSASILGAPGGSAPGSAQAQPAASGPSNSELQARAAGMMAGTMLVRTSMMIGGDEFIPREFDIPNVGKITEERMLQDAFGTYFAAKQMTDVPPGVVLSFAIMAYIAPRFAMPKTREKTRGFVSWFKEKIVLWRVRRSERKNGKQPSRSERSARVTPGERAAAAEGETDCNTT